jgi:hypothetical protein
LAFSVLASCVWRISGESVGISGAGVWGVDRCVLLSLFVVAFWAQGAGVKVAVAVTGLMPAPAHPVEKSTTHTANARQPFFTLPPNQYRNMQPITRDDAV